ncbi:MAG TPA: CerR family C-terminal domain-containing protein [Bryobacteraceae bacterium]|jgi:AcrR family transcriptional regulator|nr:CerR family C-terminal domain-containing protein [Bryobacteraceae bacterium]
MASGARQSAAVDETRSKLLRAAFAVFTEGGYHGSTIREICKRANVNIALVNYHFGDKLELYTEVLRYTMKDPTQIRGFTDLLAQDLEPELILRQFIRLMMNRIMQRREQGHLQMQLILHELARPTPAIARVVDESIKPLHQQLRSLLAQILGLSPDDDKTRLCAQSIVGQVIHYAHHAPVLARLWPELKMTPTQMDMVASHIADFSLAYLRAFRSEHSGERVERKEKKSGRSSG